ncbi:hypothetical protein M9H77_12601 [Catharanthus roseus]|uniref:Uncharacterized protein n=1 Tax=Catharanthus roseus TaxID=4058 RepID=A0ACC0BI12_CATRO|nr:hypothetical protein M9H77_12601 [Catharanthus roseus]
MANEFSWSTINCQKRRIQGRTGKSEEEEKGERKVHCEVEVISWRERRIKAEIVVKADVESVWNALTDYERLADFVPNLVSRCSISIIVNAQELTCKNSLSPSWENLVGAERTTKGALLAYRSSGCVGSPRTSKISKHQLTLVEAQNFNRDIDLIRLLHNFEASSLMTLDTLQFPETGIGSQQTTLSKWYGIFTGSTVKGFSLSTWNLIGLGRLKLFKIMLLQIVHIPLLLVELDGWKSGENGTVAAPFKLLAVADMENHRELIFSMVDGDFKKFEGKWSVKAGKSSIHAQWLEERVVTKSVNTLVELVMQDSQIF